MLLRICLCAILSAVGAGTDAVTTAEDVTKVVAAGKTAVAGNFADTQVGFKQKTLGCLQADTCQIFAEPEARNGFKAFAKIGFFHTSWNSFL